MKMKAFAETFAVVAPVILELKNGFFVHEVKAKVRYRRMVVYVPLVKSTWTMI